MPATVSRAPRSLHFTAFLLLLFAALACRALVPPTATALPNTEGIRITYPTCIETVRGDAIIAVFDHKGLYRLGFPGQWEVGAFDEHFVPTVEKYAQINPALKSLFQAVYGKDPSLRIFAIDTDHLSKDNMTVLSIGMFQNEQYLQASIEDLTAEYVRYLDSSGQMKITDTFQGTTNGDIPFSILITEPISQGSTPVYDATILVKTDKAYLEMQYTTLDQSIDIVEEMRPMLASFDTLAE